jgi:hypothetical protein
VQDHASPDEILNFSGSLPTTSAAGLQSHETVWIAKDPQPRGSLEYYVSTSGTLSYRLAKHLTGQLVCHTGNSPHYIKNSTDCVRTLGSLRTRPQDTTVSFNVALLFITVPIRETMSLLS